MTCNVLFQPTKHATPLAVQVQKSIELNAVFITIKHQVKNFKSIIYEELKIS